jgi:hypothetical protein
MRESSGEAVKQPLNESENKQSKKALAINMTKKN